MENRKKLEDFIAAQVGVKFGEITENHNYWEARVEGIGTTVFGLNDMFAKYDKELKKHGAIAIIVSVGITNFLSAWIEKR